VDSTDPEGGGEGVRREVQGRKDERGAAGAEHRNLPGAGKGAMGIIHLQDQEAEHHKRVTPNLV